MQRKSPKTSTKNKGREGTSLSVGRQGGALQKQQQKCECFECSRYQAKFKPAVHPCPNFKKTKKMASTRKPKKFGAPKKVVTSRWVVPPRFDSQRAFPPCRCMPPSEQVSGEESETSLSASSSATSLGRDESETDSRRRAEEGRNLREDFYVALDKQAEKTSDFGPARSAAHSLAVSHTKARTVVCHRKHLMKRVTRAAVHGQIREVGRAWMYPGREMLGSQDRHEILQRNLPRSVSQGLVSSDPSTTSVTTNPSSAKSAKSMTSDSVRRTPGTSRPGVGPPDISPVRPAGRATSDVTKSSSAVSFSVSNADPDPVSGKEESATKVSGVSLSSSKSRGLLKDPRSTAVRSNSARLFLEEEQLRKLQEQSASPEAADMTSTSYSPNPPVERNMMSGADSSINSDDPVPNARLAPSRQFMNICAQELAKRKLIARAKAAQELDSTNLFCMESHYEVFAIEKKINGCTWGVRAYRTV